MGVQGVTGAQGAQGTDGAGNLGAYLYKSTIPADSFVFNRTYTRAYNVATTSLIGAVFEYNKLLGGNHAYRATIDGDYWWLVYYTNVTDRQWVVHNNNDNGFWFPGHPYITRNHVDRGAVPQLPPSDVLYTTDTGGLGGDSAYPFGTYYAAETEVINQQYFPDNSQQGSFTSASHGFSVGNVIVGAATLTSWAKAQANSLANCEDIMGIVVAVPSANEFTLQFTGRLTAGATLITISTGTLYYIDPSTAGTYTSTKPTSTGQFVKPILIGTDNGEAWMLDRTPVEVP